MIEKSYWLVVTQKKRGRKIGRLLHVGTERKKGAHVAELFLRIPVWGFLKRCFVGVLKKKKKEHEVYSAHLQRKIARVKSVFLASA